MDRDLMHSAEVKEMVRDAYRAVDSDSSSVAARLYSREQLASVPRSAADRALGVGNHLRYADIEPGSTVLDVGCGAGIDAIIAASMTGPDGRVIGLDFLSEMLSRTEAAAAEAGLTNVETLEGEMEAIPLPDASVDHVISNGVINLSPRKSRALAEIARVLRSGGDLCMSDLTMQDEELPPEVLTHPAAWAGCVAGVLTERLYLEKLERAGFDDVQVVSRQPFGIDECAEYPLFTEELITLMRRLIPTAQHDSVATSVVIKARVGKKSRFEDVMTDDKGVKVGAGAIHHFDAGDLGCASGLAEEFRRRLEAIAPGDQLEVVARDPAAKEDLPSLARMLGHQVNSLEPRSDGGVVMTVERRTG
ncbi:MAG TPA: methyltransferase domain-containing protein [Actinomycetota bacterium]|nr:methyltransferase domain-containing protein [Actinomycetota bacterium]